MSNLLTAVGVHSDFTDTNAMDIIVKDNQILSP